MSVQLTYFVHGTSKDNENHISSGWKDVELSELGLEQAKKLQDETKNQEFDVVFASDLQRAAKTAELAFGGRFKIVLDERLRECNYGEHNGGPSEIVEPLQEKAVTVPFKNGESYEDVKNRIASLVEEVKRNYDGKRVAFVAHKAPQLALDVLLKNMTWEEAFKNDWRNTKAWQSGWEYRIFSENENFTLKRKALLVPFNSKGEILIQDRRGHKPPDWGFFGGGIEEGENSLEAVIREAKEELDLDLQEPDIHLVTFQAFTYEEQPGSRFIYLYKTDQEHFEDLEAGGAHWMTVEEAKSKMESFERLDIVQKDINHFLEYE